MSEGIKRMLAEREKVEARKAAYKRTTWDDRVDETFALIDRAAPFMDEAFEPGQWKPSTRLKLLYVAAATSPNAHVDRAYEATMFIHQMLDKARQLWVNGYHPDPWREIPVPREGA